MIFSAPRLVIFVAGPVIMKEAAAPCSCRMPAIAAAKEWSLPAGVQRHTNCSGKKQSKSVKMKECSLSKEEVHGKPCPDPAQDAG